MSLCLVRLIAKQASSCRHMLRVGSSHVGALEQVLCQRCVGRGAPSHARALVWPAAASPSRCQLASGSWCQAGAASRLLGLHAELERARIRLLDARHNQVVKRAGLNALHAAQTNEEGVGDPERGQVSWTAMVDMVDNHVAGDVTTRAILPCTSSGVVPAAPYRVGAHPARHSRGGLGASAAAHGGCLASLHGGLRHDGDGSAKAGAAGLGGEGAVDGWGIGVVLEGRRRADTR